LPTSQFPAADLRQSLAAHLPPAFGREISRRPLSVDELSAAKTLADDKYGHKQWTQRC
jgi:hypothetical protein